MLDHNTKLLHVRLHVYNMRHFIFFFYFFYSCFIHSHFTEAYRRACLVTTVKLLEKVCRGVKPESFTQNYPDIPVACMNLVASVSDFVHCNEQQVCQANLIG